MSTKENFTAKLVADFVCQPNKQQSMLWDGKVPGLGLRVTANGVKSYIFESRLHGRTVRITIGDIRTWPIGKAQAEATRLKALTDQGIDPRAEKAEKAAKLQEQRAEARRREVLVHEVWEAYIKARKPKWSERTLFDHVVLARAGGEAKKRGSGLIEPGPLAQLMEEKLTNLTPERIAAWLEEENQRRPTRTALAYRLLRAFLRWASDAPAYKESVRLDAVGSRVSRDHVHRVRAKEADCLQREQLAPWFDAVRLIPNPVQAAYLQCLLLTGARREEMAGLRWEDVDFRWKSMTIADKVEEGGRIIPLTPYVSSLLKSLPRRNQWVFSSPTAASGRIQEPRIGHIQALKRAGLPHLSLHGLRRSFGTLAEWVECPVGVVAQIMGHKPSAIAEKHYRRRPLDLLRMWHIRIEAWILEQAGIEQPGEQTEGLKLVKT